MITLQQVFDKLVLGDLVNTQFNTAGSLESSKYKQMTHYVNEALLALYTRFAFKKKELQVQQIAGVTNYYLRDANVGDVSEFDEYTYILYDEDGPLQNDLLKVDQVFNALQEPITLNDNTIDTPIMTPEVDVLQMTPFDPPELLTVIYRARYPEIIYDESNFDPTRVKLSIPHSCIQPMLTHIAAAVYRGINSTVMEGILNPAMTFANKYEFECSQINMTAMDPVPEDSSTKFKNRGWV